MKRFLRRAVVPFCIAFALSCASHRIPEALRGYDIVIEPKDPQSTELARAMRSYGFRVRDRVRGGSRPTAALIYFMFRDPAPGESTWLHVRLADTRSGVVVGAGAVPLDSLAPTPRARARAVIQTLLTLDTP